MFIRSSFSVACSHWQLEAMSRRRTQDITLAAGYTVILCSKVKLELISIVTLTSPTGFLPGVPQCAILRFLETIRKFELPVFVNSATVNGMHSTSG